jgi:hypothetical protein
MTGRGLRVWIVALAIGVSGTAWAQRPTGDAGLLPADGFAPGWARSGPLKVFTSSDLYGYIDGGAEAFLEIGFEQLTVQKYRNGANELTVELYRMTDPTAARGIYVARCGKETPEPSVKARHTASRHQILLQRHRYFLALNNTAGGAANAPILATAALAMIPKMPADGPVPVLASLPSAGLVAASARIFRGPVGLQAVYTLGDGDILLMGGKVTAVAGDYRDPSAGAYTLIVADFPAPGSALAAFKHLKSNLDSYLKATSASDARLVFQDYEKKYGVASVSGKRLEVRLHLVKPPA